MCELITTTKVIIIACKHQQLPNSPNSDSVIPIHVSGEERRENMGEKQGAWERRT